LLSGSDRNTIDESDADGGIAIHGGDGIRLQDDSNENRLTRNTVDAEGRGIAIWNSRQNLLKGNAASGHSGNDLSGAERTVIVGNTFYGGPSDALALSGSDDNLIRDNAVPSGYDGIHVSGGEGNVIRSNSVGPVASDGIRIEVGSMETVIADNVASNNRDDGIDIAAAGALVRRNVANDNGDLGIEAVGSVIDGGGNRASGNGNPLQCLNVFCK
jgi:parallel beta-helix repeat protein